MGCVQLFLIASQLICVFMYSKTIFCMCKYCWQLIIRYKRSIRKSCLDLSVKIMKYVQCIDDKMMKCLRDNNVKLQQQQQEDSYGVISTPIQETDEQ